MWFTTSTLRKVRQTQQTWLQIVLWGFFSFYFVTFIAKHKFLINSETYPYTSALCSLYKVFIMDHLLKNCQYAWFSYFKYSSCSLLFNVIPIGNHHLPFCKNQIEIRESVFISGKHTYIYICVYTHTSERYFEN